MNSSLAATIHSLVRTPAGRFHMWAGGRGSGLDYVILLSEEGGLGLDYG